MRSYSKTLVEGDQLPLMWKKFHKEMVTPEKSLVHVPTIYTSGESKT